MRLIILGNKKQGKKIMIFLSYSVLLSERYILKKLGDNSFSKLCKVNPKA